MLGELTARSRLITVETRRGAFRGDPLPKLPPALAVARLFLGLNWNRAVVQQFPQ